MTDTRGPRRGKSAPELSCDLKKMTGESLCCVSVIPVLGQWKLEDGAGFKASGFRDRPRPHQTLP